MSRRAKPRSGTMIVSRRSVQPLAALDLADHGKPQRTAVAERQQEQQFSGTFTDLVDGRLSSPDANGTSTSDANRTASGSYSLSDASSYASSYGESGDLAGVADGVVSGLAYGGGFGPMPHTSYNYRSISWGSSSYNESGTETLVDDEVTNKSGTYSESAGDHASQSQSANLSSSWSSGTGSDIDQGNASGQSTGSGRDDNWSTASGSMQSGTLFNLPYSYTSMTFSSGDTSSASMIANDSQSHTIAGSSESTSRSSTQQTSASESQSGTDVATTLGSYSTNAPDTTTKESLSASDSWSGTYSGGGMHDNAPRQR